MCNVRDLTYIIKTFGRPRFMQQYRRGEPLGDQIRQQNVPSTQNISVEASLDDISTIHSGISEGDVSMGSHISITEEELNELTTEQLRTYLLTLTPTTIPPRGNRRNIIAQLIPIIQTYNQIQHRDQRQTEAQRLLQYTDTQQMNIYTPTQ
jgi:hypothetical protein